MRRRAGRRAGLAGAAVAFLQSEQGRRLVADARRRVDTPENREKARRLVAQAQEQVRGRVSPKGRR